MICDVTECINLFELEIDDDVYTQRKTSYKKGKSDYPKWEPLDHWDVERLVQYRNGWSYSEWLAKSKPDGVIQNGYPLER